MKYGSADVAFFLLDGLNILGFDTSLTDKVENLFGDTKPFGVVWNQDAPTGTKRAELTQSGFFQDGAGSVNATVSNKGDVRRVVAFGRESNVIGKTFRGLAGAYASVYSLLASRNQIQIADVAYRVDGDVEDVVILHELSAEAGDGSTEAESVDQAANPMVKAIGIATSSVANPTHIITSEPHGLISSDVVLIAGHSGSTPTINGERVVTRISDTEFTIPVNVTVGGTGGTVTRAWTKDGGAAHLHVTAITLSGRPSVTVKVRHSATNIVFADLLSMTAIAAVGAERKTVAAGTTVNRYLASSRAWGGAGGAPTVTFLFGFARH